MTAENGTDEDRVAARSAMLRGGGWVTLTELAARRGDTDVGLTGSWAYAQLRDAALLVLSAPDRSIVVPAFQLTASGEPRSELRPLLEELRGGHVDGWTAWTWLTRPNDWLSGDAPEQLAATDPAGAHRAAARFATAARPRKDPKAATENPRS